MMKPLLVLSTMLLSSLAAFSQNSRAAHTRLQAPTYYIVVSGHLVDDNTVLIRGASNLPTGSMIGVQVGDGTKAVTEKLCVDLGDNGLFKMQVHPSLGTKFKWTRTMAFSAVFRPNECTQPKGVLRIVGDHGQYLGNDNYDNKIDIHMGMTIGMINNPQLFQESGWYFGLLTSANVSE